MKQLLLIACLLTLATTFASEIDYGKIYKALDVKAVNLYPDMAGSVIFEKEVGGLKCTMETVVYPGAESSFDCTLNSNNDGDAIYNALNIEPVNEYPDLCGYVTLSKSIGGLECTKEFVVFPVEKPSYTCFF